MGGLCGFTIGHCGFMRGLGLEALQADSLGVVGTKDRGHRIQTAACVCKRAKQLAVRWRKVTPEEQCFCESILSTRR